MLPLGLERTAPTAFSKGRSGGKRRGSAMAAADDFPARAGGPLSIAKQNRRPSPSSARASALRFGFGCRSAPFAAFVAMKAAMGTADPARESRYDHRPRLRS
jgi:hypothetical protein